MVQKKGINLYKMVIKSIKSIKSIKIDQKSLILHSVLYEKGGQKSI